VQSARRGRELTGWVDPRPLTALAAAYAEAGDFEQAVKYQQQALDCPEYAQAVGNKARERLELYQAHKPYRDE
jgi:hypothetical protein